MKVVIIGGVAGGATAAARLRRLDESAEIIIIERSGYVSYANCGLPYYIGGVITEKEDLTLQTPTSFWNRFRIEVRTHQEAIRIRRKEKAVTVRNLTTGETYEESYDKLLLSPGATAIKPNISGTESEGVFTLRTVEDTWRIREWIEKKKPARAVVVGGGFIGLEMLENLMHAGIQTTLLQKSEQVMPPLDYDMACGVHAYLRKMGVDLRLRQNVTGIERTETGITVQVEGQEAIETDLVILAIGVSPETWLAKDAGLTLGMRGAIVVNPHMQTSDPDIYAVGDGVTVPHYVTQETAWIALAGPANKEGRIAADHMCGIETSYAGSQGSSVLKLFDMSIASTGLNERSAEAAGIPYDYVVMFSPSHASYYPGASNMTVKVLFHKETGRILGAQIVGFAGVDKRIDVLAVSIRAHMTGQDLAELELAYAPPFSSAKDPVNMAGFVIENVRQGLVKQYRYQDIEGLPQDGSIIMLDVRTDREYAAGHIPHTLHIPLDSLRERMGELDPQKPIYVNCQSGLRSYLACRILMQHGFQCYNLIGGYRYYALQQSEKELDTVPSHSCGLPIH